LEKTMLDDLTQQYVEKLKAIKGITETAVRIPCNPPVWAGQGRCKRNVTTQIKRFGGEAVSGWKVLPLEGYFYCEFHYVWKSKHGSLICVTPKNAIEPPSKTVVFLPQVLDYDQSDVLCNSRGYVLPEDYERWHERESKIHGWAWGYTPEGEEQARRIMAQERTMIDSGYAGVPFASSYAGESLN
jgi:hypothetical protein